MTGLTREHIMPVFWGKGRNGKGTLVKLMLHTMGLMAGGIQTELLLYQKMQRNAAGATPEIVDLKGLRMAFASETEEGQRFSASKVKWLTGGDQLVGRDLYGKKQIRFDPSHTIFLMTNNKPAVAGDDYAFWKRMHLICFQLSYVTKKPEDLEPFERVADPDLEEKLKKEDAGILAWLVRGCLAYQREGLNPPQAVLDATWEYQQEEDILGGFVEAYCKKTAGVETRSTEIFDKFDKWYKLNQGSKGISQKKFGTMMKRRFGTKKKVGVVYYIGVELDHSKTIELNMTERNIGDDHEND
jgi:putative DNA primase/helicase